ncbi:hypothetical protein [Brevundimonas aurifodinae]|uniref:UDP-N-acetylglucosamine kinase n=1 Tax=Brevundimonas aurifodinae TaxID=1508312 RepID=A0ABV1NJM1_9CAUL|nr:MAG: hypothetical protein B7Z42_08175 [Brevundimonas sp. 12-68-7]
MPTLVLLAGPNGAGKTTFINDFLRQRAEAFQFVNPDEVARGLPFFRHPPASRAFAAQTGGRSGAREREPVTHTGPSDIVPEQIAFGAAGSPGLRCATPEDDESRLC